MTLDELNAINSTIRVLSTQAQSIGHVRAILADSAADKPMVKVLADLRGNPHNAHAQRAYMEIEQVLAQYRADLLALIDMKMARELHEITTSMAIKQITISSAIITAPSAPKGE